MKNLIWIDDIRNPKDEIWQSFISSHFNGCFTVIWLKSYYEVTEWINKNGLPSAVSFDHDLGDTSENEKTGYDCCKFICEYCMDSNSEFPEYAIQSDNAPGRKNIETYINNFRKYAEPSF